MSPSKIFTPLKVGNVTVSHRAVLAPLTRFRANEAHVHEELGVEYYSQRTSVPGTLAITEATFISANAGGYPHVPGIWNQAQIDGWKKITDAVHKNGSFIFLQMWALGRTANPEILKAEGGFDLVSSGDLPYEEGKPKPRPLTKDEIKEYIEQYRQAAINAVHHANFDGVEVHSANGYLIDQFTQSVSNNRTDEYGGPIENRIRFAQEVTAAVIDAVGAERTGIRFSPWNTFQGMKEPDPLPVFSALVSALKSSHPNMAYVHVVEPRAKGYDIVDHPKEESIDPLYDIWKPNAFLSCGGWDENSAEIAAEKKDSLAIVFGRWFISNPDLPLRLKYHVKFTPYDRDTFYLYGTDKYQGYTDYPFAEELVGKSILDN